MKNNVTIQSTTQHRASSDTSNLQLIDSDGDGIPDAVQINIRWFITKISILVSGLIGISSALISSL